MEAVDSRWIFLRILAGTQKGQHQVGIEGPWVYPACRSWSHLGKESQWGEESCLARGPYASGRRAG